MAWSSSRPTLHRRRRRPPHPPPRPAAAPQPDLIAQLTQLGQLRDQGVLTEDEFAAQKARLLRS